MKLPVIFDQLPETKAKYVRARRNQNGVRALRCFLIAIIIWSGYLYQHTRSWSFILDIGLAIVGISLCQRAIYFWNKVIQIYLEVNIICRRGIPSSLDFARVPNALPCSCSHPDLVCHARDTQTIPLAGVTLNLPPLPSLEADEDPKPHP